nr:unnamed protein product [Leishmania braziliensis]
MFVQHSTLPGQVSQMDRGSLEEVLAEAATYALRNAAPLHVVVSLVDTQVQVFPLPQLVETLSEQRYVAIDVYVVLRAALGLPTAAYP